MKSMLVPILVLTMAALGSAQADAPQSTISQDGTVIQLRRGLGMTLVCKAGNIEIRADEGDFYRETNEAELRGNVRVKNLSDEMIDGLLQRELLRR